MVIVTWFYFNQLDLERKIILQQHAEGKAIGVVATGRIT
jgi:hypothetical protein